MGEEDMRVGGPSKQYNNSFQPKTESKKASFGGHVFQAASKSLSQIQSKMNEVFSSVKLMFSSQATKEARAKQKEYDAGVDTKLDSLLAQIEEITTSALSNIRWENEDNKPDLNDATGLTRVDVQWIDDEPEKSPSSPYGRIPTGIKDGVQEIPDPRANGTEGLPPKK